MDISAIALQGLDQASAQLDAAAAGIASAGAASPDGANLDVVSLSEEVEALISAKTLYSADLIFGRSQHAKNGRPDPEKHD
jgi:hypothetical protein